MSIAFEKDKCIGCGKCQKVCPGSLIGLGEDRKAYMKYPKDCWGCCSCIKECQFDAIYLYLGADIGGMGSHMKVKKRDQYLDWIVEKPDGEVTKITIDQKESNKY